MTRSLQPGLGVAILAVPAILTGALTTLVSAQTALAQENSAEARHHETKESTQADDSLMANVLDLIGFRQMTDQIATLVQGAASIERSTADQDIVALMFARALRRGFEAQRLYDVSTRSFCQRATDARLQESFAWLSAPLVKRMHRLELDQQSSLDEEDYLAYVTALEDNPPSRERIELFARLDSVSGTSEAAVEIEAAMMRAMLEGMNPSLPDGNRMTTTEIEALVEASRPEFARAARDHVQQSLLYTYRGISDAELRQYISHLESDAGLWLSQAILKSLFEAMEEGARASGEAIAESLRELAKTKA